MNLPRHAVSLFLLVVALGASARVSAQGPPFQVDDPVPVDFKHYEFYIFGSTDGTPLETDYAGPGFEFNWGAIPRVQLHMVLPWGGIHPSDDASATGLLDMEFGAKIAIIKESKHIPQIGTFTMFEVPTGNADKGLGVGEVWYKLPVWLQKNSGKWLFDGGAGEVVVPQTGFHDFPYGGFLVKREVAKKLELAAEIFSHGGEGPVTPQTKSSTMLDAGGYWHLKGEDTMQLLFAYGHSIAGQTENYGYLGLYWTWGKGDKAGTDQDKDKDRKAMLDKAMYSGHLQHGF
ncbi:hypothetical protein [Occallatibacter savannae]|uniref:hypothetical protein n=1 Tax=Occallatibacter savannae TaxID=1002691 RepID=UPI000D6904CC|nr:hypothetical protein [Occallatibacter savannae]